MKRQSLCQRFLLIVAIGCGMLGVLVTPSFARAQESARPNIIVFLFDDLGWGQPQSYDAASQLRTPHLDALAKQGMRFTDAHSAAAVCTPTRYGLLTGRYPSRIGQFGVLGTWSRPLIPTSRLTLGSLLKQQGYATACVGKWHLGLEWQTTERKGVPPVGTRYSKGPNELGFDYFCGYTQASNIETVLEQDQVIAHITAEESQPLMLSKAVKWLEERDASQPFFLYFPICPPHYPVAPAKEFQGKSGGVDVAGKDLKGQANPAQYPDWLYQGDAMLGEIVRVLEERGLAGNTLLIATSDNGAEHRAYAPLRESKRSIYEGGHRVPLVVRWPGHVEPGTTCEQPLCLNDFMATFAEITGATLPPDAGEDSTSILWLLQPEADMPASPAKIHQSAGGDLALRRGQWKLIVKKNGRRELYNLETDLSETRNVLAEEPEVAAELAALLQQQIEAGRSTPGPEQRNDVDFKLPGPAGGRQNRF